MRAHNATKCDCGRGSVLNPAEGVHGAPTDPIDDFKGATSRRRGGGRDRKGGVGRGREERGREGGDGEGKEVGTASDWL